MEHLSHRYRNCASNLWVTLTELFEKHCEIDLGQGKPGYAPDPYIQKTLADVAMEGNKYLQYTRELGHTRLVNAIANMYSAKLGRELDSQTEVLVTNGACGSISSSFLGLVNNSDEVILLEPFFDAYLPNVYAAGATPIFVPLRSSLSEAGSSADWYLNIDDLESKITCRTRFIVINNPINPMGKVFTREELEQIAAVCIKHNLICFSDEVYEWLVFDHDQQHIHMASIPGMWERTVSIFSASKSFSVTGWRVGWSVGPHHLISCVGVAHCNIDQVVNTPCQEAVARCLETEIQRLDQPDSFFVVQRRQLKAKRDRIVLHLRKLGFRVYIPQAGYFVLVDWSEFATKHQVELEKGDAPLSMKFAKWLLVNWKVGSVPLFTFYAGNPGLSNNLIRLCFFKEDSALAKFEQIGGN